jgi:ATP-dependent DNA helicase 2 subunit 2
VCFTDDVRKYTFPPLFRAKTAEGEWTTEHATIPNVEQQGAMDRYLDTLDLGVEEELNEDGEPTGYVGRLAAAR